MPGEVADRARRLPVDLVDDLLEVAPDQRLEQRREARIEPHRVEHRLVIGRPLHHPHQRRAVRAVGDLVEQIAVPEAAAVRDAFDVELVGRLPEKAGLRRGKEAADDDITLRPEQPDIIVRDAIQPLTLPPLPPKPARSPAIVIAGFFLRSA